MIKTKLKGSEKLRLPDCAGKRSWPRCLRCNGTSLMKTKNSFSKLWRSWILQPPESMKIGKGILFKFFPTNVYRLSYCYCFQKLCFFFPYLDGKLFISFRDRKPAVNGLLPSPSLSELWGKYKHKQIIFYTKSPSKLLMMLKRRCY